MTTTHDGLCAPCLAESSRWLDYRLPSALGIAHGSGAPYDVSAYGTHDLHRSRFGQWRSTVAFQRDLIARACREAGHVRSAPVATVVQLDLFAAFDLEEAA